VKKFGWVAACALLLAVGSRLPAEAQREEDLGRNWDVHAGIFVPQRGAARDAKGNVWFTAGAEKPVFEIERWRATFGVDYYGAGNVYNVPITLNLRGDSQGIRYGLGVGVGISHDVEQGVLGIAYNILIGYMLRSGVNPATIDLRYMGQTTGSGQLNGLALTLGYRF